MAGAIARGEIRLATLPAPDKARPVVVLTRNSVIASLSSVTIAPITSAIRGVRSEVRLDENDGMKFPCAVNLHNTVTIPQRWLGPRLAQLSAVRLEEVCAALNFAIGCDV